MAFLSHFKVTSEWQNLMTPQLLYWQKVERCSDLTWQEIFSRCLKVLVLTPKIVLTCNCVTVYCSLSSRAVTNEVNRRQQTQARLSQKHAAPLASPRLYFVSQLRPSRCSHRLYFVLTYIDIVLFALLILGLLMVEESGRVEHFQYFAFRQRLYAYWTVGSTENQCFS